MKELSDEQRATLISGRGHRQNAGMRKFSDRQIQHIRDELAHGQTIAHLARHFSVERSTIRAIRDRRTYRELL